MEAQDDSRPSKDRLMDIGFAPKNGIRGRLVRHPQRWKYSVQLLLLELSDLWFAALCLICY